MDDSDAVCLTLSMMLEKEGFRPQSARNSQEAFRQVRGQRFDLVVLDRNLGQESGLVLAEALLDLIPGLRVVMMSGEVNLSQQMDRCSERVRALPVLLKPFSRQELLDGIRAALNKAA